MKVKILLYLGLLASISDIFPVENNYRFRTMSPEGGFYYDGVKELEQDQAGFIWVMMDYELYRFDGYHYKKYYPYFAKLQPAKRWLFKNMASDSSGCLYVNTNNGIYRYETATDRFERIYDSVSAVKVDNTDRLWVRVQGLWYLLDEKSGELSAPLYDDRKPDYVNVAFCTYHQDLYSFVRQRIYRFNYAENRFELCYVLPDTQGYIRFAQACKGSLWAFVDKDGLYLNFLQNMPVLLCVRFMWTLTDRCGWGRWMEFIFSIRWMDKFLITDILVLIHSAYRIIRFGKYMVTSSRMCG